MSVSCESCVLSGRGLYNGLIPPSGESYQVWRVCVCSRMRRPRPDLGCNASEREKKKVFLVLELTMIG